MATGHQGRVQAGRARRPQGTGLPRAQCVGPWGAGGAGLEAPEAPRRAGWRPSTQPGRGPGVFTWEATLVAGQTQVPAHLLPPSTGWGWAVLVTVVVRVVGAQHGATEGEGPGHCDGPGRGVVRGPPRGGGDGHLPSASRTPCWSACVRRCLCCCRGVWPAWWSSTPWQPRSVVSSTRRPRPPGPGICRRWGPSCAG